MAKNSFLAGVDKETREAIYNLRRVAKEKAKKAEDTKSEQYKNKLIALQKEFNLALEEAKDNKLIPQNTTIAKIGMLPAKEPKRWATTFNRIFGRKKAKAKTKAKAKIASKSIISKITDAVSTPKPKAKQATTNKKAPAKKKKG
jgi:hypothetical protein